MTRSAIKSAILRYCKKIDHLPNDYRLDGESTSPQAIYSVRYAVGNGSDAPPLPLAANYMRFLQKRIEHSDGGFEAQIVDCGQEDDIVLYVIQKREQEDFLQVTHVPWDSIRAVQLVKRLTPRKGDMVDKDLE